MNKATESILCIVSESSRGVAHTIVLELVAEGLSNKEIASRLYVSQNTVKYHLKRPFQIFEATSRADLLAKATAYRPGESCSLLTAAIDDRVII